MHAQHASQLTRRQLALLHVAKARLGLDDETYRDLLEGETGVRSARDLDDVGFRAVLRRLRKLGFQPRAAGAVGRLADRPGMATARQLDYIRALWRRHAGADDAVHLRNWLRKRFGVDDLRFLDRRMAHETLVALKAMVARAEARERGEGAPDG